MGYFESYVTNNLVDDHGNEKLIKDLADQDMYRILNRRCKEWFYFNSVELSAISHFKALPDAQQDKIYTHYFTIPIPDSDSEVQVVFGYIVRNADKIIAGAVEIIKVNIVYYGSMSPMAMAEILCESEGPMTITELLR